MSNPSSTSSSETRSDLAVLLHTLAWCAAFLLAARLVIPTFAPNMGYRTQLVNAAEYLRQARDEDVKVVVFGSSRMRASFVADEWSRLAGLAPGQVINLSVPGGRSFDALYMLRNAGGLPVGTELVIVEVSHVEFNGNMQSPITGERVGTPPHYRRWASLGQRLALDDPFDRLALTFEYFWPLYHRVPMASWLAALDGQGYRVPALPNEPVFWNPEGTHVGDRGNRLAYKPRRIAKRHFHAPQLSGFARSTFEALRAELVDQGVEVVLLQLPLKKGYLEVVQRARASADLYDEISTFALAQQDSHVRVLLREHASDWELDDRIFIDYGHMSLEGATAFTQKLFETINRP
jgi:hypothetical protein